MFQHGKLNNDRTSVVLSKLSDLPSLKALADDVIIDITVDDNVIEVNAPNVNANEEDQITIETLILLWRQQTKNVVAKREENG